MLGWLKISICDVIWIHFKNSLLVVREIKGLHLLTCNSHLALQRTLPSILLWILLISVQQSAFMPSYCSKDAIFSHSILLVSGLLVTAAGRFRSWLSPWCVLCSFVLCQDCKKRCFFYISIFAVRVICL